MKKIVSLTAAALVAVAPAAARDVPPVVRIESGAVRGDDGRRAGTLAFRGIPYAAPAVAALRWRPPAPAVAWQGIRDGTKFGPACPQNPSRADPSEVVPKAVVQSEDCLFLNVWKPAKRRGASLPVFVWIHGGAFQVGSGSLPVYDGSALAARGMIVVTINYRMGLLGYMAHPALSAEDARHVSGNFALLDQVAALRWVRRNITAFGGDPRRVTVAGHSGGGISVGTLMVSPLAHGLFARAIVQSGPVEGLAPPTRTLAGAEATGALLMAARGARTAAELRALPVARLLERLPADAAAGSALGPVVDGVRIVARPGDTFAAGREAPVPMVIGTATGESGSMSAGVPTPQSIEAFARLTFGADSARILALFPHATAAEARVSQARIKAEPMLAASRAQAALHARRGAPTWLYVWDRSPPGPDADWQKAYHGSELPYLFGTLDTKPRAWTKSDHQAAEAIQRLWTRFVTTGTMPAPWRRYASGRPPYRIGMASERALPLPDEKRLDIFFRNDSLDSAPR